MHFLFHEDVSGIFDFFYALIEMPDGGDHHGHADQRQRDHQEQHAQIDVPRSVAQTLLNRLAFVAKTLPNFGKKTAMNIFLLNFLSNSGEFGKIQWTPLNGSYYSAGLLSKIVILDSRVGFLVL